jgi:hypothetical protein
MRRLETKSDAAKILSLSIARGFVCENLSSVDALFVPC